MTIGERIRNRRLELGLTAEEIADKLGKSRATIYRYENGEIEKLPTTVLEPLAKVLQTSEAFLMGWTNSGDDTDSIFTYSNILPISKKKFPMLGEIACGEPIFADQHYDSFVEASDDIQADFCLVCKGDSMVNARIFDGDVVFIRKQPTVRNGEIAAVIVDDEATLKRVYYYPEKNKLILSPENPAYEPLVYLNEELDEIRILGKAVAFMSDVR